MAKGRKKFKHKRRGGSKGSHLTMVLRDEFMTPSTTYDDGTIKINKVELDSVAMSSLTNASAMFEQWKIHWIDFEFVRIQPLTTAGMISMCVIPDPDCTVPTNLVAMLNTECNTSQSYSSPKTRLRYVPKIKGWRYTKDNVLNEDRFEMFGMFCFATINFNQDISPGRVIAHYKVSMKNMISSAVQVRENLIKHHNIKIQEIVEIEEKELLEKKDQQQQKQQVRTLAPRTVYSPKSANR